MICKKLHIKIEIEIDSCVIDSSDLCQRTIPIETTVFWYHHEYEPSTDPPGLDKFSTCTQKL